VSAFDLLQTFRVTDKLGKDMSGFWRTSIAILAWVASGCRAEPATHQLSKAGPFAPAATVTLKSFGAAGDGRADDTKAVTRAFANSDRYCLEGEGLPYRVTGALRVGKDLCLRNATFLQSAHTVKTTPYIRRNCPRVQNPSIVVDCNDPIVPADQLARLWNSLSLRTLLIRPDGDRPLQINLERVKVDRGSDPRQGSRSDSAGIWLDGADRVDMRDVEITGNGKGYGLLITNARNVTVTNLWIHDLVWAPYDGDRPLSYAAVSARGWNSVPIHEFREKGRDRTVAAKFYGVRIQEQLTCAYFASVSHVRIENARIERCLARFDEGDIPWQTDGLDIGRSSSDVLIDRARIDLTWEGVDVAAGGRGIDRLTIKNLTVLNAFAFGLKMGDQLRGASVSALKVDGAGLAGVVVYGPARDVHISNASIRSVGLLRGTHGPYSPWPAGNRAGVRIDGVAPDVPDGVVLEEVAVSGTPGSFEFGILNTGGRRIEATGFNTQDFGIERARGVMAH
jgi:hypothetical protein